ncbi:MAG: M20/M25/M40 family metallo-hydrolase [Fulvivirga sp.]|nr:M20/M25/M40 family metallo-hydrolase [Fulvivirga sp.]
MKFKTFILLCLLLPIKLTAQPGEEQLEKLADEVFPAAIKEFRAFLRLPNNGQIPSHVEENMLWCEDAFKQRGFDTERLPTAGAPLLLAGLHQDDQKPTLLFYMHIDGQPVDPSRWDQANPYIPVLKEKSSQGWDSISWKNLESHYDPEWRIFARSASDAKGPVIMFLAAMDVMNNQTWQPDYNVKVIMDFQEEMSSPHLPAAVSRNQEKLKADYLLILDGPKHISNQPTIVFGARGITTVQIKVFGPKKPLHSGHYGNYAPNPAMRLSQLLASMKDHTGTVAIPGFYDDVSLDEETKMMLSRVPDDEKAIQRSLGIGGPDGLAPSLQQALQYPSLNIRGLSSGWVGKEVRTIIPSQAVAEIDIRLVKESDGSRLAGLVKQHIEKQDYYVLDERAPSDEERNTYPRIASFKSHNAYAAFRTPMDSKIGVMLEKALERAFTIDPVKIRTMGGSVPIAPFIKTLNIPAVVLPMANADNNQHSPNENLRLGNFKSGIISFLSVFTAPAPE